VRNTGEARRSRIISTVFALSVVRYDTFIKSEVFRTTHFFLVTRKTGPVFIQIQAWLGYCADQTALSCVTIIKL